MSVKTKDLSPSLEKSKENGCCQTTIGKYLLDKLYEKGVEHIFGVPGDYVLNFDKQIEQHTIHYINATRENTAGYMADAYARLRGLGVACITYGVGVNITNALAQAFVESSPLIVISGSASSKDFLKGIRLHHLIHQQLTDSYDTSQLDIFKQVTIGQAVLNNPETAQEQIDSIIGLCLKAKKPVYIEIPSDKVETPLNLTKKAQENIYLRTDETSLEKALKETRALLKTCRCPVIWAGHEIQRYGLSQELLQFAERQNIPIVTSLLGKAIIDEHHSLFIGTYQGGMSRPEVVEYINRCDCVLMLGLMLTDIDTGIFTAKLDHEHRIIVNASMTEIDGHRDRNVIFSDFLKKLATLPLDRKFPSNFPAPASKSLVNFVVQTQTKITTKRVFECIQSYLQSNNIVFADIGDCLFGSADLILEKQGFLACAHFGSLGFATPGSLGAQLANPEKRVIALVGDGAFQMTCTELSTAVRYGLDPIIILFNNHGYGTERPLLEGAYNDIQNWNYSKLPLLLNGGVGSKVTTEEEMALALKAALSTRGQFHIIEVELDKTDFSPALKRFGQLVNKNSKA